MAGLIQAEQIELAVLLIRGQRVMLDRDLAALYGVTTGNLNKAVQRDLERFPANFMFQLTTEEAGSLRFQFGSSKRGCPSRLTKNCWSGWKTQRTWRGSSALARRLSTTAPPR